MKTVNGLGCQGDVAFVRVRALPKSAKAQPDASEYIVAHSETGHHHVARAKRGYSLERLEDPAQPLVSYLRIRQTGEELRARADQAIADIDAVLVEHQRSFDTHETLALACDGEEAIYKVIRQRQSVPEGWAAVVD